MNDVPFLGSYGYVAPVAPALPLGKRVIGSLYFWLAVFLFVVGATIFVIERKNKEEKSVRLKKVSARYPNSENGGVAWNEL